MDHQKQGIPITEYIMPYVTSSLIQDHGGMLMSVEEKNEGSIKKTEIADIKLFNNSVEQDKEFDLSKDTGIQTK